MIVDELQSSAGVWLQISSSGDTSHIPEFCTYVGPEDLVISNALTMPLTSLHDVARRTSGFIALI